MQKIHNINGIDAGGACAGGEDHLLFFSERSCDLAEAQKICGSCNVQMACLAGALERREDWGVWGGVIFWDGEPFYRRRGRGRPRKNENSLPLEASRAELWQLVQSA